MPAVCCMTTRRLTRLLISPAFFCMSSLFAVIFFSFILCYSGPRATRIEEQGKQADEFITVQTVATATPVSTGEGTRTKWLSYLKDCDKMRPLWLWLTFTFGQWNTVLPLLRAEMTFISGQPVDTPFASVCWIGWFWSFGCYLTGSVVECRSETAMLASEFNAQPAGSNHRLSKWSHCLPPCSGLDLEGLDHPVFPGCSTATGHHSSSGADGQNFSICGKGVFCSPEIVAKICCHSFLPVILVVDL